MLHTCQGHPLASDKTGQKKGYVGTKREGKKKEGGGGVKKQMRTYRDEKNSVSNLCRCSVAGTDSGSSTGS